MSVVLNVETTGLEKVFDLEDFEGPTGSTQRLTTLSVIGVPDLSPRTFSASGRYDPADSFNFEVTATRDDAATFEA
jgi:hypothetical protein